MGFTINDIIQWFLILISPPLAILFKYRWDTNGKQLILNGFLTFCFWFPAIIHAAYVIYNPDLFPLINQHWQKIKGIVTGVFGFGEEYIEGSDPPTPKT